MREADGRHALMLDGRGARTPGRNPFVASSRALMSEVAAEWTGSASNDLRMLLTRLLNSAIDGVAHTMAETRAEIRAKPAPTSSATALRSRRRWSTARPSRSTRCCAGC